MIDVNYKPDYLPQISSPFNIVLKHLDDENVKYKKTILNPHTIKPSQGIVFLDKIKNNSEDYIWLSKDLKVLDGHHRCGSCLSYDKPIKSIIIMLPYMEAMRVLNKVQDIINFKENQEDLNVESNEINIFDIIRDEYFHDENIYGGKKRRLIGYRNKPIKNKSKSGNFFFLQPIKGYQKFEIEMDNVLDTDELDFIYENNVNPVTKLAEYWFKGVDFDYLSNKNDIPKNKLISRCVSELGIRYGFDGIKYGDIILQVLK